MPALLDRLRSQYVTAQDRYRSIEALVAEADRDPTDVEQGELDSLRATMTTLQPRIVEAVELERSLSVGTEALASVPAVPASGGRPPARRDSVPAPADTFRSWGDFASAQARGEVPAEQRDAINTAALDFMIEHARAFVDVTTADVPGIVPPIWIRTIADTISAAQPFITAFSQLPLPDVGMTLTYPKIATRPLVGKQTTEKTEVPSRKTTITSATSNVVTYGGGEDVSVQVLQRTDPAYLGLMLELYAEAMAIVCNTDAINFALGAFGATIGIGSDPTGWNAALANVVAGILTTSRLMPDTFVMGTDMWAAFAGATDPDGRPLFPNASPMNPLGQTSLDSTAGNVRGMTFVVDPMMPPDTGIIGARSAMTSLLGSVQTLSGDNVAKLGRDYAVFRFAAFIARRPDAAAVVSITTGP
jgi:HK97 family phage major capsid protein